VGPTFTSFGMLGSHCRHNLLPYRISSRLHRGKGARGAQNPVFPVDFHHCYYNSVMHYHATL